MRVSIWQQFSSNHSAGFTLVGTFQSLDAAQNAEREIRRLMDGLRAWYADPQHLEELEERMLELDNPLIPIEKEFAQKYGIDEANWNHEGCGIDWVTDTLDVLPPALVLDGKYIYMHVTDITWQGSGPFRELIEKLGGTVASREMDHYSITVTITCDAPDEEAAKRIREMLPRQETYGRIIRVGDLTLENGTVTIDGSHITIADAETYEPDEMHRAVRGLEAAGCTNINYTFHQGEYSRSTKADDASLQRSKGMLIGVIKLVVGIVLACVIGIGLLIFALGALR